MNRFTGRSGRIGAGLLALGVLFVTTGFSLAALAAPGNGNGNGNGASNHIEICHFSGQVGSGVYETVTVSANSNGHFHENGTTRAGHEADHPGPCVDNEADETDETTPTTTQVTTPTTQDTTPTTTESIPEDTVTDQTTPTTLAGESESLPPDDDQSTTTSTAEVISDYETQVIASGGESPTTSTPVGDNDAADVEVETLPYTGPATYLVAPGIVLLLIGAVAVFMSHGFGGSGGTHVATEQARISLGMHRGRHEG